MKLGLATVCFNEERLIAPFLKHLPSWLDEVVVLLSTVPWQGEAEPMDKTGDIAKSLGATIVPHSWKTEAEQRSAGQLWLSNMDWVIWLDPDEFLTASDWEKLREFLETADAPAYVTGDQITYWKKGYCIDPHEEYKQIIATRPHVKFIDKRVVNSAYAHAPVTLHHLSWARTDEEVWKKISHYSHADEFDKEHWFNEVWKADKRENVHPLTPEALRYVVEAKLPKELEELSLWDSPSKI